jgi:hypothetical protein
MRSSKMLLLIVGVSALFVSSACASTILFQDGFESGTPGASPGPADVGTWSFQVPASQLVTDAASPGAAGGTKYEAVTRSGGWSASDANIGHQAVGSLLRLEADVWTNGNALIYGIDYNPTEKDGFIMVFRTDGSVTCSGTGTLTYNLGAWNHVSMDYVVGASTFDLTVNASTITAQGMLGTYGSTIDTMEICVSADTSYFDNVKVTLNPSSVPEPSVVTLLVSAIFGLVAYAWRKRR